ncbi:hypothetical protein M8542_36480 [Amycolatopsis sp. OK19-0408]|uniref:Uncharacterized protein n=1 Tax=Amycolatopsis iheyensis TaxID=2945988 RepID=A0A9X2NL72_9PSEU|nr:hypothetical protein [Amycolatopsis iheyensis]MCR6488342.1 hypothetical protein [Amycolatopsis iheyensis]
MAVAVLRGLVSEILRGGHTVTALELFKCIVNGLGMAGDARVRADQDDCGDTEYTAVAESYADMVAKVGLLAGPGAHALFLGCGPRPLRTRRVLINPDNRPIGCGFRAPATRSGFPRVSVLL